MEEKTDRENQFSAPSEQAEEQTEALQTSAEGDKLAELRAQLEEKEREAKANYDLFMRERAELENFKRRMQREKTESLRFANEPLIRDLLPVLDNLDRAVSHAQGGGNGQPLVNGVALVLRSFIETLEKHGVVRVSAKGMLFDPNQHEAMAQVERADVAPNTVVEEYTPAYCLYDRLLRPALVIVAKAPAGSTTEEKKSEE